MALISPDQLQRLIENGRQEWSTTVGKPVSTIPVVLLRRAGNRPRAWLLAAVDPDDHDLAFGLFDEAGARPELGLVRIQELEALSGVSHDPLFALARQLDLKQYLSTARLVGRITLEFEYKP